MAKDSDFQYNRAQWPIGTKVRYIGSRTKHRGQVGTIVGHRPTRGLWVEFPTGRGSISITFAQRLSGHA